MVEEAITLKQPELILTDQQQEIETKFTLKPVTQETEETQEHITLKPKKPQVIEEASEQIILIKEVLSLRFIYSLLKLPYS